MLNYSSEIRWFLAGPLPAAMAEWFSLPILGNDPQALVEDHLLLPRSQVTGIKLRDGKLQVKSLCREPSPLMITDQINGWAAGWVKWSLSLTSNSVRNFYKENPTIRLRKRRWLRKLSLETDAAMEVDDATRIEQGCRLELSALEVEPEAGRDREEAMWWSLALEAFGPPQTTDESLRRCINHFLRRQDLPARLLAADSKSYADWLASISVRKAAPGTVFRNGRAGDGGAVLLSALPDMNGGTPPAGNPPTGNPPTGNPPTGTPPAGTPPVGGSPSGGNPSPH